MNEKNERDVFVEELLDSYFCKRQNLPTEGYIQENKSSRQIRDDLSEMYDVGIEEIVRYMQAKGYAPTTEPDGTVVWAVWRRL